MTNNFLYFIGIDVSKDKVDIFSSERSTHFTVKNNKKDIRHALYKFDREKTLIILENTGGYENNCVEALTKIGFKIHRANNNKVKHFIRYNGIKAKTDKIDAEALALYGEFTKNNPKANQLEIYQPLSETEEKLRQTAYFSQTLKRFRASLLNREQSPGCCMLHLSLKKLIDFLTKEIKNLEEKMITLAKSDNETLEKYKLLQEYKGVGKVTALELIAFLPELGKLENHRIVSLSGLAPHPRDSGTIKGYRTTKGSGRPAVKRILFMAALSGTRFNTELSAFYSKKTSEGKKKMVAMGACMRKMIIQLNTIAKRGKILF